MKYGVNGIAGHMKWLYERTIEKLNQFMDPGGLELAMASVPSAGFRMPNTGYSAMGGVVPPAMYSVGNGKSTIKVEGERIVVTYGSETVSLDPRHVQHNPLDYASKKLPAKRFPKDLIKKAAKELERLRKTIFPEEPPKRRPEEAHYNNRPAVLRR